MDKQRAATLATRSDRIKQTVVSICGSVAGSGPGLLPDKPGRYRSQY
jgi:hypothetical protein